ncbi:MAG: CoA-binding protein [Candidatus Marinimicrobia bacterium]|nr:CoA-binding protein [Candidatus Neomarinimicrobiota bacterium]MCF7904707.1 CoA-binding protein [Candidatus Neomarinimicrobiota bacterium]
MTAQALIKAFLEPRKLAIAGMSRSGKKFGNIIFKTLTDKGYEMLPVHPENLEFLGAKSYGSIADLPVGVENLVLVIPPAATEEMVRLIPGSGIKRVWMQQGAESDTAIQYCEDHGIDVVHHACVLMHAEPKGIHKFHRWLGGVFGKLPR